MHFAVYNLETSLCPWEEPESYTIDRSETWKWNWLTSFEKEEDAKEYVRKNILSFSPNCILRIYMLKEPEKSEMLERFCFDNDYLLERKLFIVSSENQLRNLEKSIISKLKSNHIKVIKN